MLLNEFSRIIFVFLAASLLASCGGSKWNTSYPDNIDPAVARGWNVADVDVRVPETLSVSEENSYAPNADIVWHGDPEGNRHQQVDQIITAAARRGVSGLRGGKRVRLVVTVSNFHGITEKTRTSLSSSGVHSIQFTAQIFDIASGPPPDAT